MTSAIPPPGPERRREPLLVLAAYVLFLSVLLLTWSGWRPSLYDEECMLAVTRAILFQHTVKIALPSAPMVDASPYGLGQSILFVPAVLVAHWLRAPPASFALELLLASLTNTIVVAGVGALLFAAGRSFGLPVARAVGLGILGAFGTPLFSLTQHQMSEPITALALLAAALGVSARASVRRQLLTGALYGFAVLARPVELVVAPALLLGFACDAWWRRAELDRRSIAARAAAAAAGFAPFLALHLWYNAARFGSIWVMGYKGPGAPNVLYRTTRSAWEGASLLLFSRYAGFVWFAPAAVLGLVALPLLLRRRQPLGPIGLSAFALQTFIHARTGVWDSGPFWGPRYLVPVMPLLLCGLVPLLERGGGQAPALLRGRLIGGLVVAVGLLSVAVNGIGAMHDTVNTHRRFEHGGSILAAQWERISPADIESLAMRPTSGTFWPTLNPFGLALAAAIGVALLLLALGGGRMRPARLAAWIAVLAAVFLAARELAIPYRVLGTSARPAQQSTNVDLASAIGMRGEIQAAPDAVRLGKNGRALLMVHLRRGIYRFRLHLAAPAPQPWTLSLIEDNLAAGEVEGEERAIASAAVRVYKSGDYPLVLVRGDGPSSLVCRSLVVEKLASGGFFRLLLWR